MKIIKERPYVNSYLGGAILGVVLFLAFFLTGTGLGASGGITRFQTAILDLFASHHVNNVPYFCKIAGGSLNPLDHPLFIMVIGVIIGGMLSGIINKRFKFETRKGKNISDKKRWVLAFVGGMIMMYGARLARGCTSGQGLSGGSVLSVGSWAFMLALFAGGYLIAYFFRKIWEI